MQFSQEAVAAFKKAHAEKKAEEESKLLLALVETFGVDDYPDFTVIRFHKTFSNGGHKYSYAAIKANNAWYVTGPVGALGKAQITWDELVIWLIANGEAVDPTSVSVWDVTGDVFTVAESKEAQE